VFPRLRRAVTEFNEAARVGEILRQEAAVQAKLGPTILKAPYWIVTFPTLPYFTYGYEAYFSAYAQYPQVMQRHFALQADLCVLQNRAAARAYQEGQLPPIARLDHDMADSRGTLVSLASLERLWFPHFARSIEPALKAGVRLIWHCDGNLMRMIPPLIDCGVSGFQGFQYEEGMDYPAICRLKDRRGRDLIIWAGVSVTRTLPHGTPDDVRRELRWLVDNGPRTGLFLGWSSSLTPGTPWENIRTHLEGLAYYRQHGRDG
jgi:uroporphyrinogen decarboxylase